MNTDKIRNCMYIVGFGNIKMYEDAVKQLDELEAELSSLRHSHALLEKDLAYQEGEVLPRLRAEIELLKANELVRLMEEQ